MDYLGAGLLGVSLLCLCLCLTLSQRQGWVAPPIVALFAAALATGTAFVAVQLWRSDPLIELRILRAPLLSVIAGFVTFTASSATIFLLPFYLQSVLEYAAVEIGLLLAVAPVAMEVSSPVAGVLSNRFGVRRLTLAGLVMLCAAYAGLTTLDEATARSGSLRCGSRSASAWACSSRPTTARSWALPRPSTRASRAGCSR
jgi:Na+/melibiose symporter-like transporter